MEFIVSEQLHDKIVAIAARRKITPNALIIDYIENGIEGDCIEEQLHEELGIER